jgi:hypothetical protein
MYRSVKRTPTNQIKDLMMKKTISSYFFYSRTCPIFKQRKFCYVYFSGSAQNLNSDSVSVLSYHKLNDVFQRIFQKFFAIFWSSDHSDHHFLLYSERLEFDAGFSENWYAQNFLLDHDSVFWEILLKQPSRHSWCILRRIISNWS